MLIQKTIFGLLIVLGIIFALRDTQAEQNIKNFGVVPAISAERDNGKQLTSEDLKDKFLVINFFFTSCEGPCPILMEQVRKLAGDIQDENIRFLSFTVDQDTDTLPVLADYRIKHGLIDPRIILLRTSKSDLDKMLNDDFKLGNGSTPVEHSTRFVLVDDGGVVRKLFSGSYRELLESVKNILKK